LFILEMGAACWRRAHEYAALDGEPTESEQRMAVEELHAEIARLEQIRVRQEDDARHMTFMVRQLQATSGRKFHAFQAKKELAGMLKKLAATEERIAAAQLALDKIQDLMLCVRFVRTMRLYVEALEAFHRELAEMDAVGIMQECEEAIAAQGLICKILSEPLLCEQPEYYEDGFDARELGTDVEFREELIHTLQGDDDSLQRLLALDPVPFEEPGQDLFGNSILVGRMQEELEPRAVRALMNRVDVATKRKPEVLAALVN
jgi:hypothetical protein